MVYGRSEGFFFSPYFNLKVTAQDVRASFHPESSNVCVAGRTRYVVITPEQTQEIIRVTANPGTLSRVFCRENCKHTNKRITRKLLLAFTSRRWPTLAGSEGEHGGWRGGRAK